jgi:hypothetical protein
VIGDRVLRGVIGAKREEVTECWRKIHDEKLHILSSLESL